MPEQLIGDTSREYDFYTFSQADTGVRYSIHNLGMVGHIEDIAVAKDQQGKKLGLRIIQALDYVAEQVGCYKVHPNLPYNLVFPHKLTSIPHRQFSIAPKPTKDSMSSVDTGEQAWKWRITTKHPKAVTSKFYNLGRSNVTNNVDVEVDICRVEAHTTTLQHPYF
jgi:hypothetical protein